MDDAKEKKQIKTVSRTVENTVENISVLCYAISKKKAAIFKDVRTAVTIVTYVISLKCIY